MHTRAPAPRTWRSLRRRAGEIRRESGPAGLIFTALADLGYRRLLILERELDDAVAPIAARTPVAFAALEPAQIDAYLAFHAGDPREEIEARLARGDTCYVARHEGRIVGASWVARGASFIRYLGHRYEIPPDEVYLYDSFTDRDFRGRSIAPALGAHVLAQVQRTGVRRATIAVVPENTANRRARAKTGFRVCGRISCLRLGRRAWHWRSGAP